MCCGSECGCGSGHRRHHHRGHRRGGCSCGGQADFGPSFWSNKEKIAWLEEHLENLQAEAESIKERIAALKGEE